MRDRLSVAALGGAPKLVLLLPFVIFGMGVYLYVQTDNKAYIRFARAQEKWRETSYTEAIQLYETVYQQFPKSRYADDALWEIATIYYVNFYDINHALIYFQKLLEEYPQSPLAQESCLKLAEIHEAELADIPQAIAYWKRYLWSEPSVKLRRQVLFQIANAHFKINRFDEAFEQFRLLVEERQDDHLAEQSLIRMGMIMQIQKRYEESIDVFRRTLDSTTCSDCRLQAQLGLVEDYEFVNDLEKALETAKMIRSEDYPPSMRESLIERLSEKRKHDRVKPWIGLHLRQ